MDRIHFIIIAIPTIILLIVGSVVGNGFLLLAGLIGVFICYIINWRIKYQYSPTYQCGHRQITIILDDNELSITAYEDWVNSVGHKGDKSKCWECYCKDSQTYRKEKK